MSSELTIFVVLKYIAGAALAGLVTAWGWIAKDHSDRLKKNETDLEDLNLKLASEYHNKAETEKHIHLTMLPVTQRLDDLISLQRQGLEEQKRLNDRLIRVETKQR